MNAAVNHVEMTAERYVALFKSANLRAEQIFDDTQLDSLQIIIAPGPMIVGSHIGSHREHPLLVLSYEGYGRWAVLRDEIKTLVQEWAEESAVLD